METILIICAIVTIVCIIGAIIAACSPFIPMVVEHKSWKVWKQCYNDNSFIKTDECKYGVHYDWTDTDYYATVFKEDNEYKAAIFRKHVDEPPVFCTYYKYHARKLAKKLMNKKDEDIYVFICAKSNYFGQTFEYSATYAIGKSANMGTVIDHVTEEMNKSFEEYLDGINPLPRAGITCMNEISKELYDRLHQGYNNNN